MVLGIEWGLFFGVLFNLCSCGIQSRRLDIHKWFSIKQLTGVQKHSVQYRIGGPLFFFNVNYLCAKIENQAKGKTLILIDMSLVGGMDTTAVEELHRFMIRCKQKQIEVSLMQMPPNISEQLSGVVNCPKN